VPSIDVSSWGADSTQSRLSAACPQPPSSSGEGRRADCMKAENAVAKLRGGADRLAGDAPPRAPPPRAAAASAPPRGGGGCRSPSRCELAVGVGVAELPGGPAIAATERGDASPSPRCSTAAVPEVQAACFGDHRANGPWPAKGENRGSPHGNPYAMDIPKKGPCSCA